jgi:UDP-N-acetylmuramyl pentapeptide phosphotransferase/UDP-N-acetylglucosamine-1-phosphate transferase
MSDFIFIAATLVFFAICALYVHWCDKIIGPDDFPMAAEVETPAEGGLAVLAAVSVGAHNEVPL